MVSPRRRSLGWWWLLLLLLLAFAGWRGWLAWQTRQADARAQIVGAEQRMALLEESLEALRRDQRSQAQRQQQADATNRVLRDELLGIGQRAALLEDNVSKLADPDRHGAQALRVDEVEMLLTAAAQRLDLASDLDGARRSYALAAGLLNGIDDPAYLSLRQTLAQERTALDAVGADPRNVAAVRLEAFAATLHALPERTAAVAPESRPWWQRAFGRIVDVRPTQGAVIVEPADRAAGLAAMQLEFTLARAALERRDADAYRAALARVDAWLTRLWPDSAERRARREKLRALKALPLTLRLPVLGSSLQQLRALRGAR
ncbi:uroporphyrinogen-III C-methyltransferase [Luteimonas sp. SX5]|uniref:Uroporphyrinogen-III C-methyltransferase n=1 Tax=Luteimonas galliterrae TaxID=2940486 RepID=A0ABT0MNM3_9GAMM|nr:uroporphyrinogen-III C-methyltransferase [Luteimonas galliterrae]MCL1635869.1 uroporphyrinogen-III C-methyltransferase [Luteimonas galliterrae]